MSSKSVSNAKQFLVNRILEQASREGVELSEVDVKMLGFAEASASAEEMETAAIFERDFDDKEYESRIAKLIRRAYDDDRKCGEGAAWDDALSALVNEDMYLLVMIDRSGIRGSPLSFLIDWRFALALLPAVVFVGIAIVVGLTRFGARFIPNDLIRLALVILLLLAPLLVGKIGHKKTAESAPRGTRG